MYRSTIATREATKDLGSPSIGDGFEYGVTCQVEQLLAVGSGHRRHSTVSQRCPRQGLRISEVQKTTCGSSDGSAHCLLFEPKHRQLDGVRHLIAAEVLQQFLTQRHRISHPKRNEFSGKG